MFGRDRHDRGALVALALALTAIVFIAWIENRPHPPSHQVEAPNTQNGGGAENGDGEVVEQAAHFGLFTPADTYAQWIMAALSIVATGISAWAVVLLRDTLQSTRDAVRAADDAVDVTREMGIKQVRAYVFCEQVSLQWDNDSIKRVVFIWKNSGQSPAGKVSSKTFITIVRPTDLADVLTDDNLEEFERQFAGKVAHSFISPGGDMKAMTDRISAEDVAEWRRGRCAILAHGIVRYIDEFNDTRFSRSCFRLVHEDTPTKHVTHFQRLGIGNHYQ